MRLAAIIYGVGLELKDGTVTCTGQIMGTYAATFAMVGGTFAIVDCLAETMRGKFLLSFCLACTGLGVAVAM